MTVADATTTVTERALEGNGVVRFRYEIRGGLEWRRVTNPSFERSRAGDVLIAAFDEDREAPRRFRADRIELIAPPKGA